MPFMGKSSRPRTHVQTSNSSSSQQQPSEVPLQLNQQQNLSTIQPTPNPQDQQTVQKQIPVQSHELLPTPADQTSSATLHLSEVPLSAPVASEECVSPLDFSSAVNNDWASQFSDHNNSTASVSDSQTNDRSSTLRMENLGDEDTNYSA